MPYGIVRIHRLKTPLLKLCVVPLDDFQNAPHELFFFLFFRKRFCRQTEVVVESLVPVSVCFVLVFFGFDDGVIGSVELHETRDHFFALFTFEKTQIFIRYFHHAVPETGKILITMLTVFFHRKRLQQLRDDVLERFPAPRRNQARWVYVLQQRFFFLRIGAVIMAELLRQRARLALDQRFHFIEIVIRQRVLFIIQIVPELP